MWIFLKNAFISITKNETQPGTVLVRARLSGDIENLLPGTVVQEDAGTDYRFRTVIPVEKMAGILTQRISEIEYKNFTGSVASQDQARMETYQKIFGVMRASQNFAKTHEAVWKRL